MLEQFLQSFVIVVYELIFVLVLFSGLENHYFYQILCCAFVFSISILYEIRLIRKISWIQLEPVKQDWGLPQAFLCVPLTVGSLV